MSALAREMLDAIEAERAEHAATATAQAIDARMYELGIAAGLDRAAAIIGRLAAADEANLDRLRSFGVAV